MAGKVETPCAEIIPPNGYMFRCLMRYASGCTPKATLHITSAGVAFLEFGAQKDILNYMYLSKSLLSFFYDGVEPMRTFRISLTKLAEELNSVKVRVGQVRIIFPKTGNVYYLYTSNDASPGQWTNVAPLPILDPEPEPELSLDDYASCDPRRYRTNISIFSKLCDSLHVNSMAYISIRNYKGGSTGLILSAHNSSNAVVQGPRVMSNECLSTDAQSALKPIETKDNDAVNVGRDIVTIWSHATGIGGKLPLYIMLSDGKPLKLAFELGMDSWLITYIFNV